MDSTKSFLLLFFFKYQKAMFTGFQVFQYSVILHALELNYNAHRSVQFEESKMHWMYQQFLSG